MFPEQMEFLNEAENRESFFKRVACFYPTLDDRYKMIRRAYNTSKDAFRGTEREGGERYFEHLRAIALILMEYLRVKDHTLIVAALLHDLVEDIDSWTIDRVRLEFGEDVAVLVEWLTKPPVAQFESKKLRNEMYHGRFVNAPREFFLIKLSDRLHNTLTLSMCSKDKRVRKIEETERYYMPYAEEHFILYYELKDALANAQSL